MRRSLWPALRPERRIGLFSLFKWRPLPPSSALLVDTGDEAVRRGARVLSIATLLEPSRLVPLSSSSRRPAPTSPSMPASSGRRLAATRGLRPFPSTRSTGSPSSTRRRRRLGPRSRCQRPGRKRRGRSPGPSSPRRSIPRPGKITITWPGRGEVSHTFFACSFRASFASSSFC